jgi:hypothetical protein
MPEQVVQADIRISRKDGAFPFRKDVERAAPPTQLPLFHQSRQHRCGNRLRERAKMKVAGLAHLLRSTLAKNAHRIDLQYPIRPKRDRSQGRNMEIAAWPIKSG